MRWRDAISLAWRSVIRRGGRALLTVLAVALGTALLSSLLIASDAARERVLNQVSEGGPLAGIKVEAAAPSPTALDSDDPRPGAPKLIDEDAVKQIRDLPDVASVVPVVVTPIAILPPAGQTDHPGDGGLIFTSVVGADLARISDLPVTLLDGRFPSPASTTEVAVTLDYLDRIGIDRAKARSVIGTQLTLGAPQEFRFGRERRFRARWSRMQIVGVVSEDAGDGYLMAPIGVARAARTWSEASDFTDDLGISPSPYSALFVVARGLEHVSGVRTEINTVGYSTSAPETLIAQVQRYLHVVELVLTGIGIIALAIAALGISNAMLAAIRERRREIGVLKAIGATDRDVRRVFLVEAGALGLLGGAIGAAAGLVTAEILAGVVNRYLASQSLQVVDLGLPLGLLILVVIGATALALAAGVLPAAARSPHACPPSYRRRVMARFAHLVAAIGVVSALAGCAGKSNAPAAEAVGATARTTTFLTIGSSATEGDGVSDRLHEAWPYLVFNQAFPISTSLVNAAVDGATVTNAREEQVPVARELKPDVVAIWLGVDDLASAPRSTSSRRRWRT